MKTFKILSAMLTVLSCGVACVVWFMWAAQLPEGATLWHNGRLFGWAYTAFCAVMTCVFFAMPAVLLNVEED